MLGLRKVGWLRVMLYGLAILTILCVLVLIGMAFNGSFKTSRVTLDCSIPMLDPRVRNSMQLRGNEINWFHHGRLTTETGVSIQVEKPGFSADSLQIGCLATDLILEDSQSLVWHKVSTLKLAYHVSFARRPELGPAAFSIFSSIRRSLGTSKSTKLRN